MQTILRLPGARKLAAPPPPQADAVGALLEQRLHVADRISGHRFLVHTGSAVSLLPRSAIYRPLQCRSLRHSVANATAIDTFSSHRIDLDFGYGIS